MNKKSISLVLVVLLAIVAMWGCSDKSYEDFTAAVEKTDAVQKISGETDINIKMDIDTEGLDEKVKKNLDMLKDIKVENVFRKDKEANMTVSDIYVSLGGFGFDIEYYDDGEKPFIKMPMMEKYVYLSDFEKMSGDNGENGSVDPSSTSAFKNPQDFISEESIEKIGKLWNESIQRENVFKGSKSLIDTPEGEVKATKYQIKYGDELFKELVSETIKIIANDPKFKEQGMNMLSEGADDEDKSLEEALANIHEDMTINDFTVENYIDIDGYIVKEDILVDIGIKGEGKGYMKSFRMEISSKYYNIEKDQEIQMPDKTGLQFLKDEELKDGLPKLFENMFK